VVPVQTLGDAQSVPVVQVVLHVVAPQAYGVHGVVVPVWQVPDPLQVRAEVAVLPVQLAIAHWVPLAYSRQPPEPLQKPSVMQLAAPASVHWFSGSWPAGTFVQVPMVLLSAHDWQLPAQAVAQQTPCAHWLLAHSAPVVHAVPLVFLVHTPPMQTLGVLQSASTVQVVLHAPVLQAKGSQLVVVAAWQVPVPLQLRADVSVAPVQVAVAQLVPLA
jgi:hypothetical protein